MGTAPQNDAGRLKRAPPYPGCLARQAVCLTAHPVGLGLGQVADAHQVVDGHREGEHPSDPAHAPMPHLPQQGHGLEPPEDLLDELPFLLAHCVPRMAGGAAVDRTGARRGVLRDMRREPHARGGQRRRPGVVALVRRPRWRRAAGWWPSPGPSRARPCPWPGSRRCRPPARGGSPSGHGPGRLAWLRAPASCVSRASGSVVEAWVAFAALPVEVHRGVARIVGRSEPGRPSA